MSSEYQELLEKLLNSDTTDVIPQSRAEYIMLTAINSLGIDTLPEPGSRMEAYLMALITKMENSESSEGGSGLLLDDTLTKPGKAADAAAVGRRFSQISEEIANVADEAEALAALSECGIITPAYQDGTFYTNAEGTIYVL